MKNVLSILVCILWINPLFSQQQTFVHFGVQDGLSQSSVYSIFQDSKGFMWFATGDGLNRFDGQNFKTYRTVSDEKLRGNGNFFGVNIFEDKDRNIWFSERSGLVKYDCRLDKITKFFPNDDTLKFSNMLEIIGITQNQDLWFWNCSNFIFCYNIISKKTHSIEIKDTSSKSIKNINRKVCLDPNGNLWYSLKNGLACYKIHEKKLFYFLNENINTNSSILNNEHQINPILVDKNGKLIIYKNNALYSFSPNKNSLKKIFQLPDKTIFTSILRSGNLLWIATKNKGLFGLNEDSYEISNYVNNTLDNNSLASNIINCLYKDFSDNLWLGLEVNGIDKTDLKQQKFLYYSKKNIPKLSTNFIKSIYKDSLLKIWLGTYSGGLNIVDLKTKNVKLIIDKDKTKKTISCFLKLPNNELLIGGSGGVAYINQENYQYNYIPFEVKIIHKEGENFVTNMIFTKEKKLLIATENGIYEGIADENKFTKIRKIHALNTFNNSSIYQAKNGILWVGNTSFTFLYQYRILNNQFIKIDSLLYGLNVRSFYEDTLKNILWMASEKGLVKYDLTSKTHKIINNEDGLPNDYLYGIIPDDNGNLWISSNGGLCCYSPHSKKIQHYDISDGLQSNEFNTGAFYKHTDGEFFFGGINGYNSFFPDKISVNKYTPKIALTDLQIFDEDFKTDINPTMLKNLHLTYQQNCITLKFTALEFTNPNKNNYQYMLEGLDKNWVKSNKGFARYAGLKPGKYIFKVKASNNENIWSESKILLTILIQTPWWLSWWFITLGILFFVLVTFIFIRNIYAGKIRKQKQIIEKQKTLADERNRISKDMHDDLGSGLSKIAILSEILKSNIKEEKESEQLEKISSTAKDLVDSMGQIIWAINPINDYAENMIAYIREYTLDFMENSTINCKFDIPENNIKIKLTQQKRRNIFLVYKETLNNILKHAEATEIELKIQINIQNIIITVLTNEILNK